MRKGISDEGLTKLAATMPRQALMEDEYAQDLAEKLVGNWQKFESFGWHAKPEENPENWTIVNTHHRDSGLLDQANAQAIEKIMSEFPDDQVRPEHAGHWAVGWVDGYSIRVYEPDGTLTPAFKAWAEIQLALENYPILDESLYSEMENEASYKNCEDAIPRRLNRYPDERVQDRWEEVMDSDAAVNSFMDWARDNDDYYGQSDDDQGYWPRETIIDEWIEEVIVPKLPPLEPGEEGYEEPDPLLESFATGPVPVDPRQMALPFKGGRRRAQNVHLPRHWVNEDTGEVEYEESEEEQAKEPASFEGYGREPTPDVLRQRLPLGTPAPRLPPGFEGFSEEEMSGRRGRRRAQAVPPLPVEEEEELNPEDLEEVQPQREKFDWNDYIWGPFRKQKPARRVSQMSIQDDAIVRMVTQEDARLVKYRGGLALVPVDGYAYPVDDAGAELALAHGAEDWTNPQARMKAGGREVLVEIYKGVSDTGLERIAQKTSGTRRQAYESYYKGEHGTGETGNEILDAMARAIFVDSWATEWEYLFEEYDKDFLKEAAAELDIEVPSFMQAELMEIAPPTEPEAYQVAQKMYDAIEQENGINLETFLPQGYGEDDYLDRSDFGHYLAMESMGHGVSWSDSHEDHGLKVPSVEGYVVVDEVERLRSFIEQNYEFGGEEEEQV